MPFATELPPPSAIGSAITAAAGGGQTNATLVATSAVVVGTVATAADSIKLPPSQVGTSIQVLNNTATSMQVFGSGTDTINGAAAGTGVAQAANIFAIYVCLVAGKWNRLLQG